MKKYKVVDIYEGREFLGYADSMAEVKRLARGQVEDTDGECLVVFYSLNPETGKYKFSEYKPVSL